MKKKMLLASLAGLGLLASCNHDEISEAPKGGEPATVSYAVSVEDALAQLQSTLDGMQYTRASEREVGDVLTLYRNELAGTRAADGDAPLAYIVNFEEGGYAILGADLRQAPVVAIVYEHSMAPATLASAKRAVDAGEEVDTPTFVNALVADYLERSLAENEPRPRIGTWKIIEDEPSKMRTKWGPNYPYGSNLTSATVAFCQFLVYNKQFNRIGFTSLAGYTPDWNQLKKAATTPKPERDYESEVHKFCLTTDDAIRMNMTDGRTMIATVKELMTKFMPSYKSVQLMDLPSTGVDIMSGRIREMLYNNNMPILIEGKNSSSNRYAWVMDGWQMQEYDGMMRQYYVYCNFGKEGVSDGLYTFGNFLGYNNEWQFISYNFGD